MTLSVRPIAGYGVPITSHEVLGYDSGAQTLTYNATLTLTHGLGMKPKIVEVYLTNVTAEGGYTTGDEISASYVDTSVGTRGVTIQRDATNIKLHVAAGMTVIRSDNYASISLVAANWTIGVRAFA